MSLQVQETQVDALEQLCEINGAAIDELKRQIRVSQDQITRIQKALPVPLYEAKWGEIKYQINQLLEKLYYGTKVIPVKDIKINLRKEITLMGSIWKWELVLPMEMGSGGRYHKIIDMTSSAIMPAFCDTNELFVRFLAEKEYITQYSRLNLSGGCGCHERREFDGR